MLLTTFGPPFHITANVPRGVACAVPGGPGSMRTGPNATMPSDCSQVRCLDRSTHAAAAGGHALWSRVDSASDPRTGAVASDFGGWLSRPLAMARFAVFPALPGVCVEPGLLVAAAPTSVECETATYAAIVASAVDPTPADTSAAGRRPTVGFRAQCLPCMPMPPPQLCTLSNLFDYLELPDFVVLCIRETEICRVGMTARCGLRQTRASASRRVEAHGAQAERRHAHKINSPRFSRVSDIDIKAGR